MTTIQTHTATVLRAARASANGSDRAREINESADALERYMFPKSTKAVSALLAFAPISAVLWLAFFWPRRALFLAGFVAVVVGFVILRNQPAE